MGNLKTVKEILKEDNTKDEWVWESIIKEKSINLLSGDESSGKSTLMINLCKAISDGEDFLGYKTKKQRILYISSEMSRINVSKTFEAVGLKDKDNISITELHNEDLSSIKYDVATADLIIVDLFIQLLINENIDPNVYKEVNDFYSQLRCTSPFNEKTIILVHHLNKLGGINGSVSIGGASDTRLNLYMPEKRQSPERLLKIYGKNVEQKEININFDFSKRLMSLSENTRNELIDRELASIIEEVVARGEVSGSCQEVSAILKLSRYGRNPNSLKKYLNGNIEVLNQNDIELASERTKKERIIKLMYNPKVTE